MILPTETSMIYTIFHKKHEAEISQNLRHISRLSFKLEKKLFLQETFLSN